uniref:Uncharacterized protein n=1 Tax=viral metagenome TaxID=1070528 RepID=A0A6H1ZUY4_9ZZZZ
MKNKEINEHIELARQSGYNEACYLNEKKLKEIEEELIDNIPISATPYSKEMMIKKIKQIFAKHKEDFPVTAGDIGNGRIIE